MFDFVAIIVFITAYLGGSYFAPERAIYIATGSMLAVAILQVVYLLFLKKGDKKQYITLALIIVFSILTLTLHNPIFVKLKPTAVNLAFAITFLLTPYFWGKNLTQKMLQSVIDADENTWKKMNFSVVCLFIFHALVNTVVAFLFSEKTWVFFKLWGSMSINFCFIALFFLIFRKNLKIENDKGLN